MKKYKHIFSLDDLVKFCEENQFNSFSSKDSGYQLSVQIPADFSEDEADDDRLLFGNIKAFHIGLNRNGSSVTKEAAEKAMQHMAYRPVLANFCEIDGEKDFTSHDFVIDDDGKPVYLERQVGCITADAPYLQFDEETGKEFVFAKVAIPREYTETCEILERKNGTKVSVELLINEMSYSAKEKVLQLTDVIVKGITLLGKNPNTGENVKEGMAGARLSLEDFSAENNSIICYSDQSSVNQHLIEMLEKLNTKLENLPFSNTNNANTEGGEKQGMKLTELMNKYNITETDITFETEELSDEELEAKFEEIFGDHKDPNPIESDNTPAVPEKYSVTMSDGSVKEFSLSLNDIQNALYNLVNDTYSEADNAYYSVTVYEDNTVVMFDWWNLKAYRQTYSRDNDNFMLTGDRVEVFQNWLTADEENALKEMKENYAALQAKVNEYELNEARQEKYAVLDQEKYAVLTDTEEFKNLKNNVDKYSVEEITKEVKAIHSDYISAHPEVFSMSNTSKKNQRKVAYGFSFDAAEKPYGNLFNK